MTVVISQERPGLRGKPVAGCRLVFCYLKNHYTIFIPLRGPENDRLQMIVLKPRPESSTLIKLPGHQA